MKEFPPNKYLRIKRSSNQYSPDFVAINKKICSSKSVTTNSLTVITSSRGSVPSETDYALANILFKKEADRVEITAKSRRCFNPFTWFKRDEVTVLFKPTQNLT